MSHGMRVFERMSRAVHRLCDSYASLPGMLGWGCSARTRANLEGRFSCSSNCKHLGHSLIPSSEGRTSEPFLLRRASTAAPAQQVVTTESLPEALFSPSPTKIAEGSRLLSHSRSLRGLISSPLEVGKSTKSSSGHSTAVRVATHHAETACERYAGSRSQTQHVKERQRGEVTGRHARQYLAPGHPVELKEREQCFQAYDGLLSSPQDNASPLESKNTVWSLLREEKAFRLRERTSCW